MRETDFWRASFLAGWVVARLADGEIWRATYILFAGLFLMVLLRPIDEVIKRRSQT